MDSDAEASVNSSNKTNSQNRKNAANSTNPRKRAPARPRQKVETIAELRLEHESDGEDQEKPRSNGKRKLVANDYPDKVVKGEPQ